MMKGLIRLLLQTFLLLYGLSLPVSGEDLPRPVVCQEMDSIGERLLNGDLSGFFFSDGLGGEFPIPVFLKAVKPSSKYNEVAFESLMSSDDHPANGLDPAALRRRTNPCDWIISISFGARPNFRNYAGDESLLDERSSEKYITGDMTVWVLEYEGLKSKSIVAANDEGYVAFRVQSTDLAFWLIDLYQRLREGRVER